MRILGTGSLRARAQRSIARAPSLVMVIRLGRLGGANTRGRAMTARRLALAAAFALFPLTVLAEPVEYTVPGTVPLIRQDSPNVGWSALATMMESWKTGRVLTVKEV